MKKVLSTPLSFDDVKSLSIGDVIYVDGIIVTARDSGHKRRVIENVVPSTSLEGGVVFHAGPITKIVDGKYQIVAIGPTTSMRMEKYQADFIKETGVRLVVGKGGMGQKTTDACKKYGAIHAVFPGGSAVVGASQVEEVISAEWLDLGMPEAFYTLKVKEFGPLIVSIDVNGNNLFEDNKKVFNERKAIAFKKLKETI